MDKKVLAEVKELIDSWDLAFLQNGPFTPALDEDGLVHLVDKNGHTAVFMNQADYLELVKYKESKNENHSMVEEPLET